MMGIEVQIQSPIFGELAMVFYFHRKSTKNYELYQVVVVDDDLEESRKDFLM